MNKPLGGEMDDGGLNDISKKTTTNNSMGLPINKQPL